MAAEGIPGLVEVHSTLAEDRLEDRIRNLALLQDCQGNHVDRQDLGSEADSGTDLVEDLDIRIVGVADDVEVVGRGIGFGFGFG